MIIDKLLGYKNKPEILLLDFNYFYNFTKEDLILVTKIFKF